MEKQEVRSKWDELAREIGAELPPDAQEVATAPVSEAEPPSMSPAAPSSQRQAAKRQAAPPKRSAADWAALNAQLGLEAPPVEPSAEEPRSPVKSPPSRIEPPTPAPERSRDQPTRGRRRDVAVAAEAAKQVAKAAGGEATEEDMVKTSRRAVEAGEPVEETSVPLEPAKSASASLWHKIFGLPAEQTAKMEEAAAKREEDRSAAERRRDVAYDRGDEMGEDWAAATVEEVEFGEEEMMESSGMRSEQPTTEDKPRRGRRRRRGRRSTEARGAERQPTREEDRAGDGRSRDVEEDFDVEEDEAAIHREETTRQASKGRGERRVESDFDLDEAEEKRAPARSAAHRNIPSWEETIGTIVDLNLQSRAERRQSSHSAGRSGSARGRVRGRRRKKS